MTNECHNRQNSVNISSQTPSVVISSEGTLWALFASEIGETRGEEQKRVYCKHPPPACCGLAVIYEWSRQKCCLWSDQRAKTQLAEYKEVFM